MRVRQCSIHARIPPIDKTHRRQMRRRPRPHHGGTSYASPSVLYPRQRIHLSLIGPIIHLSDEAGTHRIPPQILPFFRIAVVPPQLRIPVVLLPDGNIRAGQPSFCHRGPPELHPCPKARVAIYRTAEEMHMIGHYDISSDLPSISALPGTSNKFMDGGLGQKRSSPLDATGNQDQCGPIIIVHRCGMRRRFAGLPDLSHANGLV